MALRGAAVVLLVACAQARDIRVRVHGSGVRTMTLEAYVAGVLAGESATFTSPEAMKAMAVAARTFAVSELGRHSAEGFDFCETTHCQDLRLDVQPNPRVRAAVAETDEELLFFEGRPAVTYYHRQCGGTTAAAHEIWPKLRVPYLRSQPDTFCVTRGRGDWTSEIAVNESVTVTSRTASGRVAGISVGGRQMTFEMFQRLAGWGAVRSNNFHVERGTARVRLSGTGFGHGVGLCQTGAEERGKAGHTWMRILEFYYPGTGPAWRHAPGERVDGLARDIATARELAAAADAAADEVQRLSGLPLPPGRVSVRTYPTIAAYRDATGAPGWMAATTRGRTVRLQPLGLLRSRGVLRGTLAHEMLHVAVDANARAALPDWFVEGLVLSFDPGKPSNRSYAAAQRSVASLIARHGRETVISWLVTGLPADVAAAHRMQPALPR